MLVVGGDGRLGSVLVSHLLARSHEVVATTRRAVGAGDYPVRYRECVVELDLRDPVLPDGSFDVVYLMAAITGVVAAENHPHAWRVNAEAPASLALQAQARGAHVVFMSSGTVEKAPHTASAAQKRYVDLIVTLLGGCVVRPLPMVPPDKYAEVADLLASLGERRATGTVRWGADL